MSTLQDLLEPLHEIVYAHQGVIDKHIGRGHGCIWF